MTQRDMAGFLDIDVKTIRNWRDKKPNLYRIIMKGFAFDALFEKLEQSVCELNEFRQSVDGKK